MKKIRYTLAFVTATVLFFSCLDDRKADYPSHGAFATVHTLDTADAGYYFTLDDQKTVYPGDVSRVGIYDASERDGKRAVIYFSLLEQPAPGYDYNAALYSISDILTKSVETASTDDELKAFGDDGVSVETAQIAAGWLNLFYAIPTDGTGATKHRFSLVDNRTATPPAQTPEGYTYLEFHHHADDDTLGQLSKNYVSFKLGSYDPATTGAKGIYLKITTLTGKSTYLKVAPQQESE